MLEKDSIRVLDKRLAVVVAKVTMVEIKGRWLRQVSDFLWLFSWI